MRVFNTTGVINSKLMWVNHINNTNIIIGKNQKKLAIAKMARDNYMNKLSKYKEFINDSCNLDYVDLTNIINLNKYNNLKFRYNEFDGDLNITEYILSITPKLYSANVEIRECQENLDVLIPSRLSWKEYVFVIREFNNLIVDKIIAGYIFNMGYNAGSIFIKSKESSRLRIDWKESNRVKKELLEQGKIPFNKITAPEGEPWFKYHTEDKEYWWYWTKHSCTLPNKVTYSFHPIKGNHSIVRRLHDERKNNPFFSLNIN